MSSANSIVAWINYTKLATLTASSSATNFAVTNIANDQGSPSVAWQSVAGVVTGATITIKPLVSPVPWDVISLHRTNLTAAATITTTLYSNPSTSVWTAMQSGPVSGYAQVIVLPPASTMADYCVIQIDDATNPDGFLSVPLCFAGAAWRPLGSLSYATTYGRDATVAETVSRGGSEYPALYYQRRRIAMQMDSLRSSETWQQMDPLLQYASGGSNVLVIPNSLSAYVQQEACFGRLKPTADISFPYQSADRRRWNGTLTERL